MKNIAIVFVVLLVAACSRQAGTSTSSSALRTPTDPSVVEAFFVRELDPEGLPVELVLSNQVLRIHHGLKNTSDRDIILYDLENRVLPQIQGPWGIAGGGLSSECPRIILAPGQSVCRWIELTKCARTTDHAIGISVQMEGTGYGQTFWGETVPSAIQFSVGYESKVFDGKSDGVISSVLSTPELTIQLK